MEGRFFCFIMALIISVFLCQKCLFPTEQISTCSCIDSDGHGITISNTFYDCEYCRDCMDSDCSSLKMIQANCCRDMDCGSPQTVGGNATQLSWFDSSIGILTFVIALFGYHCQPISENADVCEEKVILVAVRILLCASFFMLAVNQHLKRRIFNPKLASKIGDRELSGGMEGDQERSVSEASLRMMVRLRKTTAQASDINNPTLRKKKCGGHDFITEINSYCPSLELDTMRKCSLRFPPECGSFVPDHCFNFRRDADFRQTVTACPLTLTAGFASHFASLGQPGSGQLDLQKEGVRLSTFKDFPPSVPVSALRLAQAGFYSLDERDCVKCFSCGATHQNWKFGDRPAAVHKRISPDCAFVKRTDTTNVPLPLPVTSRADFTAEESYDSGFVSAGPYSAHVEPGSLSESAAPSSGGPPTTTGSTYSVDSMRSQPSSEATENHSSLATSMARLSTDSSTPSSQSTLSMYSGVSINGQETSMDGEAPRNLPMPSRRLDLGGAVYPLYSQLDARRRSFNTWTSTPGLPSVDVLVTLGFFYAGYADCVRCFFCGIGLKSWEAEDIPAEVHARWRPTCEYLRLVKGDVFVDRVATGGRNVSNTAENHNQNDGGSAPTTGNSQAGGNGTAQQAATNSGSSQQGTSSSVPDIPVVHRARESGYTDLQIAEAIEQLRVIGMEAAIDVMLVEILTNLFSNYTNQRNRATVNQPAPSAPGNGSSNAGSGSVSAPEPPASSRDADLQHDGPRENNALALEGPALQQHHNVLQQENARLREMRTCQQCHENPVGVIFLPCGHIVACTQCAPDIRRCLRCDSMIRATANVFFS